MAAKQGAVVRHAYSVARCTRGLIPFHLSVVALSRPQQRNATSSSSRIPVSSRPSRILPRSVPSRHASSPHARKGAETSEFEPVETQKNIGIKPNQQIPFQDTSHEPPILSSEISAKEEDETAKEISIPSTIEDILGQDTLVVTREVEMMNIFLGFEQANKYALNTAEGKPVGYLAESEKGMLGGSIQRQVFRNHRPFEAQIMDTSGNVMMIIRRSFTFINSKIRIYTIDSSTKEEVLIGEVHQIFHIYRRKYELFLSRGGEKGQEDLEQFAEIDEGLFAWDFMLKNDDGRPLGAISRNFRGFGRELFTDTGQYVVTFDPTTLTSTSQLESGHQQEEKKDTSLSDSSTGRELTISGPVRALSMQERAVALATAVSADFDYFSRHSQGHTGGGMMPWLWMGGSGGGGSKEAEPIPGQDSSGVEAPPPMPGSDRGPTAGTGATYDAFGGESQSAADQAPSPSTPDQQSGDFGQGQEEVWGKEDPWGDASAGEGAKSGWGWGNDDGGGGGGGGGGDGGGGGSWFDGFFDN